MRAEIDKIFADIFMLARPVRNYSRNDIPNWDSMKHAELIIALQNHFKIRFSVEEILSINCLDDIENLIKRKRS